VLVVAGDVAGNPRPLHSDQTELEVSKWERDTVADVFMEWHEQSWRISNDFD